MPSGLAEQQEPSQWWVRWDPHAALAAYTAAAQALSTATPEERVRHAPLETVRDHPAWPDLPVPGVLTGPFEAPDQFVRGHLRALGVAAISALLLAGMLSVALTVLQVLVGLLRG